jgi:predicted dehydrogenase
MGAAAAGAASASRVQSANDTVRVAVVGVRGQGGSHCVQYGRMKNVEVAAICDIDDKVRENRIALVEKATGKKPAGFVEFRKVLEDKTIDAVSIATPNHWHTLQTIWALQAGKDVYVEKPCSYNMFEAKQIVAAAKKYDKQIVQHGTNSRSGAGVMEAVQKMRDGLIGDVYMTRGLCFKWRDTIGRAAPSPVPAGVNYDLWTGPAPLKPFTENRYHYKWHWLWDFGNGDLGNQGIHELDVSRWGLGVTYPTKVTAIGGHFMFDDDQETPNTLTALYEFNEGGKKKMMEFAVRHWMSNHEAGIDEGKTKAEFEKGPVGNTIGNIFYGSKGYLAVEGYNTYWSVLGPKKEGERGRNMQEPGPSLKQGGSNWQNFIDVVRSRDKSKQNAPIEEGAPSTVLIHLANISYQLGRTINFDAKTWTCPGDKEATALFTRKGGYRKGFVVPEKV